MRASSERSLSLSKGLEEVSASSRPPEIGEQERQGLRRCGLGHRLDEEAGVRDLVAAAAGEEAAQLLDQGAVALGGLVLQAPERGELALRGHHGEDRVGAEAADQLVLEVAAADLETALDRKSVV